MDGRAIHHQHSQGIAHFHHGRDAKSFGATSVGADSTGRASQIKLCGDERTPLMGAQAQPLSQQPLTQRPAWKALTAHYQAVSKLHLRKLFADDPKRGERMTAET